MGADIHPFPPGAEDGLMVRLFPTFLHLLHSGLQGSCVRSICLGASPGVSCTLLWHRADASLRR
eukprot:67881-Rhodomonas_salina.1